LLVEINDAALRKQGSSSDAVRGLLEQWGYELYIFDPRTGRPVRGHTPPEHDPNVVAVHRSSPLTPTER
jgi:hypothetical protein